MRLTLSQIFLTCIFLLSATAHADGFSFTTDVRFKKTEQNFFTDLKAGESLNVPSGEVAMVLTPQGLPLLIFSPQSKNSQIALPDSDIQTVMQEQLRPTLEKSTREIVEGLRRTESALQKRDYNQALATITPLKDKYKNLSSVLFMSGTVHYLMNNKTLAAEELQQGLAIDPENAAAKNLLQQLRGKQ